MTGQGVATVDSRYLGHHRDYSEGLSHNFVKRLFDYERSHWRRDGFSSPYRNDRGGAARYRREFRLWLYWHPLQDLLRYKMKEDYNRGYGWPYDPSDSNHSPSRHRPRIDIRDPRYRPPQFQYQPGYIERGIGRSLPDTFTGPRGTRHQPHPHHGTYPGTRLPGHAVRPTFELPGAQFVPATGHPHHPNRRTTTTAARMGDPFDPIPYDPDALHHLPHRHPRSHHEQYDDNVEEDDASSLSTGESFVRTRHPPSPFFITRDHRHTRGGRHDAYADDDDDDDDDEFSRRRGGRRAGRRLRGVSGRRDIDYGSSADEDGLYG